jgi:hypothetical protein
LKTKSLIILLAYIIIILDFVIGGCQAPAAAPKTTTTTTPAPATTTAATPKTTAAPSVQIVEPKYNVLSPRGVQLPVDIKPLSARLDTFDGKTIYVNQGEADPVIMPALFARVQKDYPKATWKYIFTSSFGPNTPEQEVLTGAKAVIRGISW